MTFLKTINVNRAQNSSPVPSIAPDAPPSGVVPLQAYENIEVSFDPDIATYWCHMRPPAMPVVTNPLLRDLRHMQDQLTASADGGECPIAYFVFASKTPGVYSLGGDLNYFAECIRTGNRKSIHDYARTCVDVVHRNLNAFDLPLITMSLVQGDALGGGFETALSFDIVVAERSAKMGFPEVLFNLFPGMGAYSFLSRRMDAVRAEKMIMSGKIYTAAELHEMGLVDVLAEDGQGEAAIYEYIRKHGSRHNAHRAIYKARRRVNPISYDELRDVVDIWVDAVFQLGETDLGRMGRLTAAQNRRFSRPAPMMVAAE